MSDYQQIDMNPALVPGGFGGGQDYASGRTVPVSPASDDADAKASPLIEDDWAEYAPRKSRRQREPASRFPTPLPPPRTMLKHMEDIVSDRRRPPRRDLVSDDTARRRRRSELRRQPPHPEDTSPVSAPHPLADDSANVRTEPSESYRATYYKSRYRYYKDKFEQELAKNIALMKDVSKVRTRPKRTAVVTRKRKTRAKKRKTTKRKPTQKRNAPKKATRRKTAKR